MTDLKFLLGEFLAAPHLADLVGFIVAAGGAGSAVILAHAADALAAALPLLLGGFGAVTAATAAAIAGLGGARPHTAHASAEAPAAAATAAAASLSHS